MSVIHLLGLTLASHVSKAYWAVHLLATLLANAPKKLYVARTSSVHEGSLILPLSKAKYTFQENTAV